MQKFASKYPKSRYFVTKTAFLLHKKEKNKKIAWVHNDIAQVFGTGITVVDNLDMTGTITVQPEYKLEGKLIEFLRLFPKPLGVEMTINYL